MLMTLADRLEADLKKAMRAGDTVRVSTIRLARAAIHNLAIERGRPPTEDEILEVLGREMRRRREAIEAYTKGRRDDLVRKESLELAILTEYVPSPLSTDDLRRIVADAMAQVQAKDPRDMGRVMAVVMPKVKGRADGNAVSQLVRDLLGAGP
jgi:uncharacterized protein YqeY